MECGAISLSVLVSTAEVESSRMRIFGFFSARSSDAQTLALSAGDVGSALLDVGVVLVRELLDEAVGLRQLAARRISSSVAFGLPQRRFSAMNSAGEQHVLLQHHGHLIAQRLEIVVAYIHAADLERTVGHIVQSRHELHQTGLRRTGAADDTVMPERIFRLILSSTGFSELSE